MRPERIVCLSAEAADICARLGAWPRVVGVSAFADQTGLEHKPVVGGFSKNDADAVTALAPDLVIAFSDVQAGISEQLIRAGCNVLATNQRSLRQISSAIRLIGRAIDTAPEALGLAAEFEQQLEALRAGAGPRPRVYFEEWHQPLVTGIGWVSEIVELVGGTDIFAERRGAAARDRVVQPEAILQADPQIILASWCGQRVDFASIGSRPGFAGISAIRENRVHEISSDVILQPGPRLLEGARQISRIIADWRAEKVAP